MAQTPASSAVGETASGAPLTLEEIRQTTFRTSKQMGYDIIDVDAFLDRVEQHFADSTSNPTDLVDALRQVRFHMSTEQAYEPQDVDAFLDRIERSLTPAASAS